ncbi:MAG: tRNA (N(6)-L-threonylcarbamoyladenosine(37)-C(2))-methylthiotransferase MtaB [Clostridiales bacterium]|nr:tRNA (N(6)-L-threonylcarbamoyladenosine(37)-C(2))-methylthiotransferase MtaB [Clostridiales bacterium]
MENSLKGKTLASITLGCKVNMYDTEAMVEILMANGVIGVPFNERADIYLINTCTVTNLGDKKSRQMISRAKSKNPNALVIACGCYSQVAPDKISETGADMIIGTKDRARIAEYVIGYFSGEFNRDMVSDIMDQREFEDLSVSGLMEKTRAYIKIQEGCDRYCSYCIIPYARGPVRSRLPENVIKEAQRLSDKGFKEIVLTGIHVASYGRDLGNISLIGILKQVHGVENIKRIRMSSIDPVAVTPEFVEAVKDMPKICGHFHLSLQSGCKKTLTDMNRRYTPEDYEKAVRLLRSVLPEAAITTDIIVGFPNETEEDFKESCDFVERIGLARLHVFPYSPKSGTTAAVMDNQINADVKEERAKIMGGLSLTLQEKFIDSQIEKQQGVLFERYLGNNEYEGLTSNYINVKMVSGENVENEIVKVRLTGRDGLTGIVEPV